MKNMEEKCECGGGLSCALPFIAALVAAVIVFLVFLPALGGEFLNWDDNNYVTYNELVKGFGNGSLAPFLTEVVSSNWHPLTLFSHAVDYAIYGDDPWGHHLTNVIFHALNVFLVFFLVLALLRRVSVHGNGDGVVTRGALIAALSAALLFGLHPLRVESVAWVSERKDVLYGFFFLLSVIFYIRYTAKESTAKAINYIVALLCFLLAILSKPMAVTLPLVLIILDYYPLERFSFKKAVIEKLPFFAVSVFAALVTLWAQGSSGAIYTFAARPPFVRALVAFKALIFYIGKTIFPAGLAPLYPYKLAGRLYSIETLWPVFAVVAITICVIVIAKRSRLLLAIWAFYIVTLTPVLGIVQVGTQAAADRYTYLPTLGFFILAGLLIKAVYEKNGGARAVSMIILIAASLLLAGSTVGQTGVWKDSVTLWRHQVALYPRGEARAFINLGGALDARGEPLEAERAYKNALEINPFSTEALNNLGIVFRKRGEYDKALASFNLALTHTSRPGYRLLLKGNIADLYMDTGEVAEAARIYIEIINSGSKSAQRYNKLGIALAESGDLRGARESFIKALRLNPDHIGAKQNYEKIERLLR